MWGTMKYTNVSNGYKKQVETGQVKSLDKLQLKLPKFIDNNLYIQKAQ